ncbi:hypothetical protein [Actinoplanes solisilvae]|uniref:hypothetical protein n=1 Tax=Actinoplanes solisilvae TaxID=2486853 RepID=UPI000FD79FD3|nr:hypothetical protein [Actinoplanes solisilvae]
MDRRRHRRFRMLCGAAGLAAGAAMVVGAVLLFPSGTTRWRFGACVLMLMFGAGILVESWRDLRRT